MVLNIIPVLSDLLGFLQKAYLSFYSTEADQSMDDNVVIVDATRCQNAEELGAVLSGAINTFPGKDPLKAIGGTFVPSMQNSHKQGQIRMGRSTSCDLHR